MDTRTARFSASRVEERGEVEIDDRKSVTCEFRVRICSRSRVGCLIPSFLGYPLSNYDKSKTLALGRDREGRVTLITFLPFRF